MKLRIKSAGRTEKVDFDDNPTVAEVKESVALAFGHDVSSFELSLNGRDALLGTPDTPVAEFDIVSGDLLRIIRTNEGAVESQSAEDQPGGSQSSRTLQTAEASSPDNRNRSLGMDIDDDDGNGKSSSQRSIRPQDLTNQKAKELGTSTSQDDPSQPVTSKMDAVHSVSDIPATMDEGEYTLRSVTEPMLCRSATDCMIPQRLRALYKENTPKTLDEALCIVLHVLMLETGFHTQVVTETYSGPSTSTKKQPKTPSVNYKVGSDTRASMPPGWRVNRVHKLTYRHPSCEGAVCSLMCVPVGKQMVVHGVTAGKSRFTFQVKPSDYVTTLDDKQPMYTNLPQLSRLYKDSIAYPLLLTTRSELGLVPLNGLLALFPEIQLLILSFLDVRSLLNVSEVCQHLYNMAADRSLWRQLLLRDFGCKESESHRDCKELYKEKYKNKKDLERYRRNLIDRSIPVRPGLFHPLPPFPPTMPGYPPGYRGGDYDLDPFAGLAQPSHPFRRDPTIMPFPGQPDIVPFPNPSPSRDPILNPLPRVPNRRDPFGSSRSGRTGGSNRGFYF